MCRKVIVSFYEDESYTSIDGSPNVQLTHRQMIVTDWTIQQIEEHLDIGEGFWLELLEGEHLSFVDFYSFHGYDNDVIESINSIPTISGAPNIKTPKFLYKVLQECNEESLISQSRIEIYYKYRFEHGAGGFSEFIICCTNSPWIMLIVEYVFGKILDFVVHRLLGIRVNYDTKHIIFQAKKFYKNAALMLNCDCSELQITDVRKNKRMLYSIRFRNSKSENYSAECKSNGEIITLKKSKKDTMRLE